MIITQTATVTTSICKCDVCGDTEVPLVGKYEKMLGLCRGSEGQGHEDDFFICDAGHDRAFFHWCRLCEEKIQQIFPEGRTSCLSL